MARKAFWRPYADGVQVNEGNTLMKADNLKSIPKFLLHVFQKGPTYDSYLVESSIEGIGRNVTKKGKILAEIPLIEVHSVEGSLGTYDIDLVKKVNKPGSKMYLPQNNGVLLIINKDETCGIISCCLPDKFEAV
jgi:hypothetical protein